MPQFYFSWLGSANSRIARAALLSCLSLFFMPLAFADQARIGTVDFTAVDLASRQQIQFSLLDGTTLTIVRDRVVEYGVDSYVWVGKEEGIAGTAVVIGVSDGFIDGLLDSEDVMLSIKGDKEATVLVEEIDRVEFGKEEEPLGPEQVLSIFRDRFQGGEEALGRAEILCDESSTNIRVLVAYTPEVKAAVGSIDALIYRAIEMANGSFRDSNVYSDSTSQEIVQLELAHKMEVLYPDNAGQEMETALRDLRKGNEQLSSVNAARELHVADIVILLINNFGSGRAYLAADFIFSADNYAFGIVRQRLINGHTFTHEVGHIFGAEHERSQSSVIWPGQFNFGHVDVAGLRRTVMAYPDECSNIGMTCPRQSIFSSPDLTYRNGGAAGSAGEDNRRKIMESAQKVACFRTRAGQVFRECADCPTMVMIPSGSFIQGSPEDEPQRSPTEGPQRLVNVPAFAMSRYPVTFDEWDACVADLGCNSGFPSDEGWGRGDQPAINVSRNDISQYVIWLSEKTGQNYRLPSESEWEYATRAGTTGRFNTGNCITTDQANFHGDYPAHGCPLGIYREQPSRVGSFSPNAFGLYDNHGNVWEWVRDCWNSDYVEAPTDGSAWMTGDCSRAIVRGGSWANFGLNARSAHRRWFGPGSRYTNVGFRVARSVAP